MKRLRFAAEINPTETSSTYLHWLLTSRPFRKAGEACMYGAGGQKRVPDDFVRDFAVGFPPLPEQHAIVSFLGHETAKIAALVEEASLAAMLQERRAALISAAVTGKIDLRDSADLLTARAETKADIAAGRFVSESAKAHVARARAMAKRDD